MSKFTNKPTGIVLNENTGKKMTFAHLAGVSLTHQTKEGFNLKEMYERQHVIGKMVALEEKPTGKTELERAEVELLKRCVESCQFGMYHNDIIAFGKYVETLDPDKK